MIIYIYVYVCVFHQIGMHRSRLHTSVKFRQSSTIRCTDCVLSISKNLPDLILNQTYIIHTHTQIVLSAVCLLATVAVAQQHHHIGNEEEPKTTTYIPILEYNKEQGEDGSYKHSFKTGNNIDQSETGFIKNINEEHPGGVLVQHGEYSYVAPDGQLVNVQYTADENGFHPTGDHIPTAAPVSEEIQKSLDLIYAGIKLQQEAREKRLREDPDFAKTAEARAVLDYNGQYYQDRL